MIFNNNIIPLEVAFIVLSELRPYEIAKIALVTKNWHSVAFHTTVWSKILSKYKLTHLSRSEYLPLFRKYEKERVVNNIEEKLMQLIADKSSKELFFQYHSWSEPDAQVTAYVTTKGRNIGPAEFKKTLIVRGDNKADYYAPNGANFWACHKVIKVAGAKQIEQVYSIFISIINIDKTFTERISNILYNSI